MSVIPFMGGSYTGRSTNVSSQECVNFYYEKGIDEAEALVSTPGSTVFNSDYSGEVRGGIEYNNLAYFMIGNTLYEFDLNGNGTSRGTIASSSGRVVMAHNGVRTGATQQIMIVDGSKGYIYDNTTQVLSEITSENMTASDVVWFFDGYFVFNVSGTDRFRNTNLYDGTTVDATDFYTAEGDPDEIVSIVAEQRQLFVFGEITMSAWYNSGDPDTLFQRFQGGYSQTGCAATHTAQRFDNSVMWLSRNERGHAQVVRLTDGFQPVVVSTPEINYQLSTYSRIDDAFAYVYQQEGHEFYVLTFPTANATWVYDASTGAWHRRSHGQNVGRERYNCHVFAFGKHLMGDFENGKIYELDSSIGTIDGTRIPRIRTSGVISMEEERLRLHSLQLDMEEGVGDPNDETDTSIWLSYSKDGGHNFSNEIERSFGNTGEYIKRVIWRRLGWARIWVFRIRTWSPNKIIIKGLIGKFHGEQL